MKKKGGLVLFTPSHQFFVFVRVFLHLKLTQSKIIEIKEFSLRLIFLGR